MKTLLDDNEKLGIVQEGESANVVATFRFGTTAIVKASILTMELTLYDLASGAVIAGRDSQNVKDANDGAMASDGTLTLRLGPTDNVIVGTDLDEGDYEIHVARLTWTWSDGVKTRTGVDELSFRVLKIATPA